MIELTVQAYYEEVFSEGLLLKSLNTDALMLDSSGVEPAPTIDCVKLVICTIDVDRGNDRLIPTGIVLNNFQLNPLFLFEHGKVHSFEKSILGRINAITVLDNEIIAEAEYVLQEHNSLPAEIWELEKKSLLRGNSMGWRPLGDITKDPETGIRTIGKWEPLEVSKVLFPKNGRAVNPRFAA